MLRLVGHGIVSEKNSAAEVRGAGAPFHRRKEVFGAAMRPRNFRRSFNLSHRYSQIQTFNRHDSERTPFTESRA